MITGIVLAGGESKRMGRDKAFLELCGKTFLRHILEKLDTQCSQIIISGNKEESLYIRETFNLKSEFVFVKDIDPYSGPLNGIISCIDHIKHNYIFISTCDTPLLKPEIIPILLKEIEDFEAVIPVIKDKFQPLNTIYTRSAILKGKKAYHEKKIRSLHKWINLIRHKKIFEDKILEIDKDLSSYLSVNTPQLYEAVKRKFKEC
ncbi:molybdenum cofactor guanylyltransferase [Persephonella sp.]